MFAFSVDANIANRPVSDIGSATETAATERHRIMNVQCCFCTAAIDLPDREGVSITVAAMGDGAAQTLFAHVGCLEIRFAPILAAETVFDPHAFEAD